MDAVTLFINAIDHWRDAKGIGTALIPPPLNDKTMILGTLQRVFGKREDVNVLIVCNNFAERGDLVEFLTHQEDEENNTEFKRLLDSKNIKVFTSSYLETMSFNGTPFVTILYHCEELCENVYNILKRSKFRLVVLNRLSMNKDDLTKLYSICPLLSDFKQNEIDAVRTSTPVREMRIGVDIPEDSEAFKLLQYYDEYISTSINIFGSFDNIQYARTGDARAGISATQFCYNLAMENGWNEHLDMDIDYNVQIDALYNPTNIRDRASQTYEMIRNRKKLLSDYPAKLDEVLKIVQEHKDDHILVINKFGEFAAKVTDFLNNMSEQDICGNYHDKVDPIPASTFDGTPIFIKSGPHKGERRMMAAKLQQTYNEQRFNHGYIHVLSTSNSPDKDLDIPIDVVIITSPECEEIESYIYRLSNITFPKNEIKLYSLYVKNSSEEKRLQNKTLSQAHIVEENVKIENNCNFVVAD